MENSMDRKKSKNAQPESLTIPCAIFRLAKNTFALPIAQIMEITPSIETTSVPNAPEEILGVLDLRGKLIPVVDLEKILYPSAHNDYFDIHSETDKSNNLHSPKDKPLKRSYSSDGNTIIVAFLKNSQQVLAGLRVDKVLEVYHLTTDTIEPTPPITVHKSGANIVGVFRHNSEIVLLVDCRELFTEEIFVALTEK